MHTRARELVQYGERCGFVLDGVDGRGHWVMTHPNGSRVRVACTPGDYRGDDNTRAEMRRKSGVTPPRPRAGKHRALVPMGRFTPTVVRVESVSAKVARLTHQHRDLCAQITLLQASGDKDTCRGVIADLFAVEAEITSLGRSAPLRTFRTY